MTSDTEATLRAMAQAEDEGKPPAKAAHRVRKERALSPVRYDAATRYLWSNRLITATSLPQPGGIPDRLVPDGVTEAGRAYLTEHDNEPDRDA